MATTDILKVIPTLQAVSLVKRKRKKKKLVGEAVKDIVGINLIQAESDFIGSI